MAGDCRTGLAEAAVASGGARPSSPGLSRDVLVPTATLAIGRVVEWTPPGRSTSPRTPRPLGKDLAAAEKEGRHRGELQPFRSPPAPADVWRMIHAAARPRCRTSPGYAALALRGLSVLTSTSRLLVHRGEGATTRERMESSRRTAADRDGQ